MDQIKANSGIIPREYVPPTYGNCHWSVIVLTTTFEMFSDLISECSVMPNKTNADNFKKF